MNAGRSNCRRAAAAVEALLFSAPNGDYSDEAIRQAEERAKTAADRYAIGEVTRGDVAQAEYAVLEIKYGAKRMPRSEYCQSGLAKVEEIASAIREEARVGQRTTQDVIGADRRLYQIKALCTGVLRRAR
jgi:hypothetical protein